MRTRFVVLLLAVVACHSAKPAPPLVPAKMLAEPAPPPPPPAQNTNLDSADILARADVTSPVFVKHVLIAWADLAESYRGKLDPRAAKRTKEDAAKLAEDITAKLRAKPDSIDALMETYSEDPGSLTKEPYTVLTDSPFVPEFKNLALRLVVGEVGVVATQYGYHVMIRIAPPALDPLESADILARPANPGPIEVQHVLVGWKDLTASRDPRAQTRTKAEADALMGEILGKVRTGADITALMKQYSEDPGSKDGTPYTVEDSTPMVEPFKNLSLRLKLGEAGAVKTVFGWHVIKRVPPPPPDKLESAAILKRTETAEKVKVKHILLGWKDVHAEDPRGIARTRAELEKLVKATLAKLAKKGAAIEPLMAELSEDPGSAKSGDGYDVAPESPMVKPFLQLSLRLKVGEVGVVKTEFGIHIIKRVE